jgi:vacuolar-type H+-ATPase subunit E/Vma4
MLRDIRGVILKDAKAEGEAALRNAEEGLEAELAKVKSEGEARVSAAEKEAAELVENERRERLSWAKLEGKRVISEAKEDAARAAFDALIERAKEYSGTRQYANRMKARLASAASEVGGKPVVHVRKDDKALSAKGADVRRDADILGGAIVESRDGKLRIDISLEALLEAERDSLRKEIYERMFSEGGKAKGHR